jgi:3-phosphoshikimate 1-carboxyvinyltransferase
MTSDALLIHGGKPLRGDVRLGPDQAILETTLAIAALARGSSRLLGVISNPQLEAALAAWRQLGVDAQLQADQISVLGPGLDALSAPTAAIECGRSPRLLAQLAGVLCGQQFGTQLRAAVDIPVEHWVEVLRARGAHIGARGGADAARLLPPVSVAPLLASERLHALDASLPFSDAVGKDAILLNALFAAGPTVLSEPQVSSDHLERALVEVGLPLRRIGSVVSLDTPAWSRELPGLGDLRIPGSAAQAAMLAGLAQALPGSDITLRGVSANPAQGGVLDLLRSWGAPVTWNPLGDTALREPVADLRIQSAAVRGGVVDADLLLRSGEAVPALWLIGTQSRRGVRLCDLNVFSPQQGDPGWSSLDALFAAFGVAVDRGPNELFIPPCALSAAGARRECDAKDDPLGALAACTLALATPGATVVQHALLALTSLYPGFIRAAQELGAAIEYV